MSKGRLFQGKRSNKLTIKLIWKICQHREKKMAANRRIFDVNILKLESYPPLWKSVNYCKFPWYTYYKNYKQYILICGFGGFVIRIVATGHSIIMINQCLHQLPFSLPSHFSLWTNTHFYSWIFSNG